MYLNEFPWSVHSVTDLFLSVDYIHIRRYTMKKLITIILILSLMIASTQVTFAEDHVPLNYLALGDSIAYGIGADYSYVQKFSTHLEKEFDTVNLIDMSFPGVTSTMLKNSLVSNPYVVNADIITVSIGGNDFLQPLMENPYNISNGDFSILPANLLITYANNLRDILIYIKTLNPDVIIYVNNLYNPFNPYTTPNPTPNPIFDFADSYVKAMNTTTATVVTLLNDISPLTATIFVVDIYSPFADFDHPVKEVVHWLPETFWELGIAELEPLFPYLHPTNRGQKLIFTAHKDTLSMKNLHELLDMEIIFVP